MRISTSNIKKLYIFTILTFSIYVFSNFNALGQCIPLTLDNLFVPNYTISCDSDGVYLSNLNISLDDDFKGRIWLNESIDSEDIRPITVTFCDTVVKLTPTLGFDHRSCHLISSFPIKERDFVRIDIPAGTFEISPEYIEVDTIDIDEDLLENFSVAGAWHKKGLPWNECGMFSIIDDDSLDGQIRSSSQYGSYGYFSLLYPLLESLGLRGNLAAEGRRMGLTDQPPKPNDNFRTLVRLQNEKGWDILAHSMMCLGEILNNWRVDSINSQLSYDLLASGTNNGEDASTISIYDLQTKKQYWPNSDNTAWIETPSKFIKPYVGDYFTQKPVQYNYDFNIDWHWGEWKRYAVEFGLDPKGFVTHNSTSSHAMLPDIMHYFPHGFSDLSTLNINTPPLLSSAVRSGLEGQSLPGYDGNNNDNTFNEEHYKAFCTLIDDAVEQGGWIMFNLHTYRGNWKNSLPGSLVSEGGTYPDEWVIPLKGVDSANDPYDPPSRLGIKDWSEWYPCPGTRLHMMWEVLKYAKEKGLINVTCSEGFEIMGNKKSYGYFSNGHKVGMDWHSSIGIRDKYPHYVIGATDETYYYNPIVSEDMSFELPMYGNVDMIPTVSSGKLSIVGNCVSWFSNDNFNIQLRVLDITGKNVIMSNSNQIFLDTLDKGTYIVCAFLGNSIIKSIKIVI